MTFIVGLLYSGEVDKFLELGIVLTASNTALYVFFEAFWKTYEEAVENEEDT